MIIGIGTDIVEISRIARAITSEAFLRKCYTADEVKRCRGLARSFAGYFAAKESVAKALGTGFRGFLPRDVEIVQDEAGRPFVRFGREGVAPPDARVYISISHGRDFAVAVAVIWRV